MRILSLTPVLVRAKTGTYADAHIHTLSPHTQTQIRIQYTHYTKEVSKPQLVFSRVENYSKWLTGKKRREKKKKNKDRNKKIVGVVKWE